MVTNCVSFFFSDPANMLVKKEERHKSKRTKEMIFQQLKDFGNVLEDRKWTG